MATKRSGVALARGFFRRIEPDVVPPVWSRDWDVLIILDACRVDQMDAVRDEYDCVRTVDSKWSQAACSIDWIDKTFNEYPAESKQCGYITANPFANNDTPGAQSADLDEDKLAYFDPLYEHEWAEVDGIKTVPPERVSDYAIDAWRDRDDLGFDRLIVHYMQPHEPYITHPEWGSGDHEILEDLVEGEQDHAGQSVWKLIENNNTDVTVDELWNAGVDNLQWVMDNIQNRVVENMDADIVLSADHGNAMGEWGEWHHPPGAIAPAVRKVPWVRVDGTDTETVDPEITRDCVDPDAGVAEQLEALGYR